MMIEYTFSRFIPLSWSEKVLLASTVKKYFLALLEFQTAKYKCTLRFCIQGSSFLCY